MIWLVYRSLYLVTAILENRAYTVRCCSLLCKISKFMWIEKLNDYTSFEFEISIPINKSNFINQILNFDSNFILASFENQILSYQHSLISKKGILWFIDDYINLREQDLKKDHKTNFIEYTNPLTLLDFTTWRNHYESNYFYHELITKTPVFNNNEWTLVDTEIVSLTNYSIPIILIDDLEKSSDSKLTLWISSSSNIWFDKIDKVRSESSFGYEHIYFDNSEVSSRISPRFNSFLNSITETVKNIGGRVELIQKGHDSVSLNGIFNNP